MIESLQFRGSAVVVSGAAAGIGFSCCEVLADLGARIIAVDKNPSLRRNRQTTAFGNVWPDRGFVADASVDSEISEVVDEVAKEFGEIAALVNVAGMGPNRSIVSMDLDFWNMVISNSLTSVYLMTSKFLPIIKDNVGSIVSVSSTYAFSSRANKSAYSAAKAGIVGFTKTTAIEAGKRGIRANAVCPGPVLTPRRVEAGASGDDSYEEAARQTLLGRFAEPREIANLVAFLASGAASYITGSAVVIDGGQLSHIGAVT